MTNSEILEQAHLATIILERGNLEGTTTEIKLKGYLDGLVSNLDFSEIKHLEENNTDTYVSLDTKSIIYEGKVLPMIPCNEFCLMKNIQEGEYATLIETYESERMIDGFYLLTKAEYSNTKMYYNGSIRILIVKK